MKQSIMKTCMLVMFLVHVAGVSVLFPVEKHENIVETVNVNNVALAVRVFNNNTPVGDLKKEDFELYLDGKKTAINGFFSERKQLVDIKPGDGNAHAPVKSKPRIFVLIFNISDYHQELTDQVEMLFDRIIRPGDRLIVITNNHFFPEWVVTDQGSTKAKILKVLEKEVSIIGDNIIRCENELKAAASFAMSRIEDAPERKGILTAIEHFALTYQFATDDMREQFVKIPVTQYIKVAEYLRSQQAEKWVLNFYQLGRMPMMDKNSYMGSLISAVVESPGAGSLKQRLRNIFISSLTEIQHPHDSFVDDIGKAFLNSGATFHTLMMKAVGPKLHKTYKYQTVSTETEHLLKRIAHLTGGQVMLSNDISRFIPKITAQEDIIYNMTYAIQLKNTEMLPSLEIKVKNKNYRVVHDNQKRLKGFRKMIEKMTQGIEQLDIGSIQFIANEKRVKVQINNIELVEFEEESFGAIRVRCKIVGKNKQLVRSYEKTFKGIKKEGIFYVPLPPLQPGEYTLILEVRDLFSLKRTFVGDAVTITVN